MGPPCCHVATGPCLSSVLVSLVELTSMSLLSSPLRMSSNHHPTAAFPGALGPLPWLTESLFPLCYPRAWGFYAITLYVRASVVQSGKPDQWASMGLLQLLLLILKNNQTVSK